MRTKRQPSGGNLSEWLEWGTEELAFLDRREARFECERFLEALLGVSRTELYLAPRPDPFLFPQYSQWIQARKNRTPLAYLLGKASFWDDEFELERDVFIPRPETEILIEAFLKTSGFHQDARFLFLDLGTGSGNIAVTLARLFPKSLGIASDLSQTALGVAGRNAQRLGVREQVQFIQADGLEAFGRESFDVIFSNPPYVVSSELASLAPELDWEPRLALEGGEDGGDFYRKILEGLSCLKPGGGLWVEMGWGAREAVQSIFEKKFREIRVARDWNQIERVVSGIDFNG